MCCMCLGSRKHKVRVASAFRVKQACTVPSRIPGVISGHCIKSAKVGFNYSICISCWHVRSSHAQHQAFSRFVPQNCLPQSVFLFLFSYARGECLWHLWPFVSLKEQPVLPADEGRLTCGTLSMAFALCFFILCFVWQQAGLPAGKRRLTSGTMCMVLT